jgi:hypothetical protein
MPVRHLRKLVRELRDPDPWAVLLIAGLGALVAPIVIYWGHWTAGFAGRARAFTSTGQFDLWLALLSGQTGLWAVALIPLTASVSERWSRFAHQRVRAFGSVIAVAVGLLLVFGVSVWSASQFRYPLPGHKLRVGAIVVIGFAVASLGILAMALLNGELRDLKAAGFTSDTVDEASEMFIGLRSELQTLLLIEGTLVGAAVLATSALRNAILAWATVAHPRLPPNFPAQDVLAYGAAFSALLALFWAPIHIRLMAVGTAVQAAATPRTESQSLIEWQGQRDAYATHLGLSSDLVANFRAGVAILAPLGSALVGLLLKP